MRVLLLLSAADAGGGQEVTHRLATGLLAAGDTVLLAARPGGSVQARAEREGVPFTPATMGDSLDLIGLLRLVHLIRRFRPDVIHAHLNRAALWGSLAGRLANRPVVATVHGMNRAIYYRRADRILAVCAAVGDHLVAQEPGLAAKVHHIYNPVEVPSPDPARVAALREQLNPRREPLLLVAGKLHPNKGQRLALETLAQLGPGHILLLAGDGPDRAPLEAAARLLPPGCRAHLLGHRTDILDLMALADLVLVPSESEAFGLAAAEALCVGTPVVAARTGGVAEVVGENGLLLASRAPAAWAAACRQLLADGDAARARAAAARPRIATWSRENHVRATRTLYQSLIPADNQ